MDITINWQTIITAAAVIGAVVAIVAYFAKIVRWVDKQKQQSDEIEIMKNTHKEDMADMKKELTLIVYGNLAALKGLQEQGCNGPVTEAIHKIEKHLNKEAHR